MSLPRTFAALALLFLLTNSGPGDLVPRRALRPKPPIVAPLRIVEEQGGAVDSQGAAKNDIPKIVIPKSLLVDLQRQADALPSATGAPAVGTIIAGLALSAAAISLMFVLRRSPRRRLGLACLTGCVLLGGFALLADVPALPRPQPKPEAHLSTPPEKQSKILIEIQEQGHEVILTLPGR